MQHDRGRRFHGPDLPTLTERIPRGSLHLGPVKPSVHLSRQFSA
jgi:hypothetical protein